MHPVESEMSPLEEAKMVYGVDFTKPGEAQAKIMQVLQEKGWSSKEFNHLSDLVQAYAESNRRPDDADMAEAA